MENHPIPQDITGFQFKLIGDMTIKQFAYVAGGVIVGWFIYILPIISIVRLPLAGAAALFGAALAFLPVEGRPFDVMITNFFKAIFSPTQYIYQTMPEGSEADAIFQKLPSISELSQQQFKNFIGTLPANNKNSRLDKKEMTFFQNVFTNYAQSSQKQTTPTAPMPHAFADKTPDKPQETKAQEETPKTNDNDEVLNKEALLLEKELNEAKAKEAMQTKIDSKEYLDAHQKVLELQKNLNDTLLQKQGLEKQLMELQKQIQNKPGQVFSPTLAKEAPQQETKFVRSIPQTMAKGVGLPITPEFPNIVTGIVKDPRGNPLPNILVEVKDSQDNAVRAFKTNALGQFASATPLVNGRYTIAFEDPKNQNQFDSISFEANGQIILPIEVISVDTREELRRSLFN